MSNNGNRYTDEFKADVIRMVKEGGRSVNKVAKDLGVNPQTIRNWLGEDKKNQDPYKSRISELEAELKAEKRKTADLEETVEILKKATAIFMKDNRK
jgi:transposase-like protein